MEEKAIGMKPAVLDGVHEALEGKLEVVERTVQVVGSDELLQVKPETLDGIEEGASACWRAFAKRAVFSPVIVLNSVFMVAPHPLLDDADLSPVNVID